MPEETPRPNDWFQRMVLDSLQKLERQAKETNDKLEKYQDRQIRVEERVDTAVAVIKWFVAPVLTALGVGFAWVMLKVLGG